jgi:hypothetical protein
MFQHIMDAIIREQNLGRVRRDIAAHWACRPTVPGPGMHEAAALLVRRYRGNGAQAENGEYPADDTTPFLGGHTGLEWRPYGASLEIVAPETLTLCRYDDEPLCLVCYSDATPPEGVTAEIVVRGGPVAEGEVRAGEWAGKLLLTDQPPAVVEMAARKAGAVGVISDCVCPPWLASHPPVREPEDAPDLVMWTIFPGVKRDTPLFGFNLSGRQGRRLRKLIAESAEPVRLRATVAAETLAGVSDLVNAWIPGTDLAHEEVWVLAHLSEPGARDNASGCCLAAEMARVLVRLTREGKLPPLRRTIRFLHATEVSGFLPYLQERQADLPHVIAGLCLDSCGQDFALCGGEVVLWQSPERNASFVDGLMEALIRAAAAEPVERFTTANYDTFPWHTEPFWGNDAFVSDGFFDIPTPHVGCWPDRYYHSSQDTPDQMNDNTLGRFGAIDATFLYLLATAGAREARWLGHLAAADWKRRIAGFTEEQLTGLLSGKPTKKQGRALAEGVQHLALQGADAIEQALRFAPEDERLARDLYALMDQFRLAMAVEASYAAGALGEVFGTAEEIFPERQLDAPATVYRRCRWVLPPDEVLSAGGQKKLAALRKQAGAKANLDRIWAWVNGRRSVPEIWARLRAGGEIKPRLITAYLRLLAEEGLVEVVDA